MYDHQQFKKEEENDDEKDEQEEEVEEEAIELDSQLEDDDYEATFQPQRSTQKEVKKHKVNDDPWESIISGLVQERRKQE